MIMVHMWNIISTFGVIVQSYLSIYSNVHYIVYRVHEIIMSVMRHLFILWHWMWISKNCLLIWYNGINHFNWIKYTIPPQQHTNAVDVSVMKNYKHLPMSITNGSLSLISSATTLNSVYSDIWDGLDLGARSIAMSLSTHLVGLSILRRIRKLKIMWVWNSKHLDICILVMLP